ncbi:uncharacterized protein C16orf96 homolog isoform X2 [Rissa tridactyla]|uniref:uncharacterized protein C16orf96 homolog isoform X2 n=1 Tax=Rissa tridactyla TaxID=75485 RepID=UPI0023BACBC6|nr:uncharacterized protein C16orf96 homolog isoform X2 [Rissa tridactyla]
MSVTITLAELADLAFGTADGNSPQVGALRILLRGLLENLPPQEAPAQVREDERGLPEPVTGVARRKCCSLRQQRRPWLGRAEGQPSRPSGPPGTPELPAPGGPAAEEWQMVQLRKRMEVTEEVMAKVMNMLQEMLTTTCSLKTTVEGFQEELQLLKDSFQKAGLEELRERPVKQDEHGHRLQSILDQVKLSSQELGPEPSQDPAHKAPCNLSWLMEQREVVGTHVSRCESQLQQHADSGTSEDTAAPLEKVPSKTRQDEGAKGLDFGMEVLDQVGQLQEQCKRLQEAVERLWGDTRDTQKADKAALETKSSQDELQHAMVQLSEMMQDLLQRMSLMDQDRQKALEKLFSEIDSKLDCAALAPLQAQLEQVWRLTQQCLCQGPCCGDNRAAGFKRQLFDPVKCISCDRPLPQAWAPHLVTVRRANQILRPHPASASSCCLAQQLPGRESEGSSSAGRGSPTSPPGPLSTSSSLIAMCSCGGAADLACKNREVDILGIDGVVYKGRLSSPPGNRTITMGKDFTGRGAAPGHSSSQAVQPPEPARSAHPKATKTPQPRSRHTTEIRRAVKYSSYNVSPYSCAARRTKTGAPGAGGRLTQVAAGQQASEPAREL